MSVRSLRTLAAALFALSIGLLAHAAWNDARFLPALLLIAAALVVPRLLARRRMRALLMSGDVQRVLGTWQDSVVRVRHAETMGPLLAATAYAAYGWLEAARQALGRAKKGPAWDAALEQRLFVETLLDTFEGDRAAALQKATVLEALPLPQASFSSRRRAATLRRGMAALARAFAHCSHASDAKWLQEASRSSPLVHWAMRYAQAVLAVDAGRTEKVRALLHGAPDWPSESAFRVYHEELLSRVR